MWPYYPIVMPLDSDGNGPASEDAGEVRKITWEVWSQCLTKTHGPFDNLPDAINVAMRLSDLAERKKHREAKE